VLTKAQVSRLRSLREKKHRTELGLFVIEGEKVVGELLGARYPLQELYATDAWVAPANLSLTPTRVSPEEMARLSHFPTPSPVLAVGRIDRVPLPPAGMTKGLTLALDGVQDAGNVGTLLRIADWFGFDRVLLSPDCADLFHQKVINASMGSFARVAAHTVELPSALAAVPSGMPILGCDLAGDDINGVAPLRDAVVVIGNEGHGLSPAVAARITRRVTIPRLGHAESLNAAVAAGIVCARVAARLAPRRI